MALVVSSVARLKPEIRLADAISQFEASLSREDKASFCAQRAQALKSPPDVMDVMHFTAQIDRRVSGKAGRCIGPRFTNFLSSIQQFAALGDIIIGGTQNIIACGIWSLVRMCILAVVHSSSHLESISMVFMEIGRTTPRHQQMALVYSRSPELQAHILEYYIVVVRFCHDIASMARKSLFRQFACTLNDTTIRSTQSDLELRARHIESEMHALVAKRVEEEAEESSRFRSLSKKFSRSTAYQQEIARKLRILDRCSSYDHETIRKQIRKIGNTSLFVHTTDYIDWRISKASSTLVYLGKLGCGKSVTMANIVDDLVLFAKDGAYHIVYFFVQQNFPISTQARTIIGSIARQLLRSRHQFDGQLEDTGASLDIEDILNLLRNHFSVQDYIFLVIDGLDICSASARAEVIDFIRHVSEFTIIMTCISYRQEPTGAMDKALNALPLVKILPLPNNSGDIETFIKTELARRLENQSLIVSDATLVLEIHDVLMKGSRGMFLWVALQLDAICLHQTDAEIREALTELPEDLSDVYAQLLNKIRGPSNRYRRRLFQVIMAAQRPLTIHEIREAVSVTPGDTTWSMAKVINHIYSTLATGGCLVVVEEEEQTVRFVHPTVDQFLLNRYEDPAGGKLTIGDCHTTMAEIIMTYLRYQVFGTAVSSYRVPEMNVGSTPAKIIVSTVEASAHARSFALRLLKLRRTPEIDISKTLAQNISIGEQSEAFEYRFQFYGRLFCVDHMAKAPQFSRIMSELFPKVIAEDHRLSSDRLNLHWALKAATEENNITMVRHLLDTTSMEFEREARAGTCDLGYELVARAICKGNRELVHLLKTSFSMNKYRYKLWREAHYPDKESATTFHPPPCYFTYHGYDDTLDPDKQSSKYINHFCDSGRTVLGCAIWGNRTSALSKVPQLLQTIDINKGLPERTPIWEAVRRGNSKVIDLLSRTGRLELQPSERAALAAEAERLGFAHLRNHLYPVETDADQRFQVVVTELFEASDSD